MEQDFLTEVENKIEKTQEEEPDNLEDIEKLKFEHKLKTFKILEDEKPSKGMIALEKKLSGYTNITMLYGPEEKHSPPDKGGIPVDQATNPKEKCSQILRK